MGKLGVQNTQENEVFLLFESSKGLPRGGKIMYLIKRALAGRISDHPHVKRQKRPTPAQPAGE